MGLKQALKQSLPGPILGLLRSALAPVRRLQTRLNQQLIRRGGVPPAGEIGVSYGHARMPGAQDIVSGGMVKFVTLQRIFPHAPRRFNILYLGSSSLPEDVPQVLETARQKGAKIVLNQNGVGYPAWAPADWEAVNAPMQLVLRAADYVFYQSRFCKLSADRFLGARDGAGEILYNPVDTGYFRPAPAVPAGGLVLLSVGTAMERYRFESAVRTLAALVRRGVDARLVMAGRLTWNEDRTGLEAEVRGLVEELGVDRRLELLPPYSRAEAPGIFQRAHLLLHTKVNDPCPMVVLEAMACGLPVVYADSGGVPELVGEDAGIGVPDQAGWERLLPPDPAHLAEAVAQVARELPRRSRAARQRAVAKFDLQPWLSRHREVFGRLVHGKDSHAA
jgi:glycosyltransferase involved in cell wall biosynthesis